MNIIGIIAEYNPFHNGHAYQLRSIREHFKEALIVVGLSSESVQRGEFASFDKYKRTEWALENGADLVLGLPHPVTGGSTSDFARGGIRILERVGINYLAFGYTGNFELLSKVTSILTNEPKAFQKSLNELLRKGLRYPLARELALKPFLDNTTFLKEANNILGLEYLLALENRDIEAFPIERIGEDYHSEQITSLSSATAIRKSLKTDNILGLEKTIPGDLNDLKKSFFPVDERLYFTALKSKIINLSRDDLNSFTGATEFLSNRIKNNIEKVNDLDSYFKILESKNITLSSIRKLSQNILLDYKKKDRTLYFETEPFLQILGFKDKARELLKSVKTPVLTTISKTKKKLNVEQTHFLDFQEKISLQRELFTRDKNFKKDILKRPIYLKN